jgi:hypothetical protein
MKEFSIDLRNSEKGERKKAVKYLREQGYIVQKKKDSKHTKDFLLSTGYLKSKNDFCKTSCDFVYFNGNTRIRMTSDFDILTLPKDWDKLIEYTKTGVDSSEEEFKEGDWVKWEGHAPKIGRLAKRCGLSKCWDMGEKGYNSCRESNLRHLTPEEIKEHLIEEAEKRGFKEGVKFKGFVGSSLCSCGKGFDYYTDQDQLCIVGGSGGTLYLRGQWAEVIEEPFKINGYEVKTGISGSFEVGCFRSNKALLKTLINSILEWKSDGVELSVKVKGEDVSYEDLVELEKYLEKK